LLSTKIRGRAKIRGLNECQALRAVKAFKRTALFSNPTAKIRPVFFTANSFLYLFSEELVKS